MFVDISHQKEMHTDHHTPSLKPEDQAHITSETLHTVGPSELRTHVSQRCCRLID
jgi:hypothetical protein